MKLRLNSKLRAALIAAVTAVGFTLTQAQAATMYTLPTYGGAEYVWHGDHWEYPEGTTVNNISRVNNKGGVMVIDNAGTVTNPVGVADTSDYGGVKVTGATNFTTYLGGWAGSIIVGADAVLNASYGVSIKNTEAATAANVYVEGTLNITDRSDLNLNDGNNYQNWYIGEDGFINLSGITGVNKGNRSWNIQVSVDPGEQFDLTGYTNRTLGGQLTKKFMSTGADLHGSVNSWAVFCEGVEMDSTKYNINHDASGMSVTYDVETAIKNLSLTWAGGEGAWEVKGTHWRSAGVETSFANGDDVTFTGSGNKANVSGAVVANAITVNGGTTIDTTASGASLTTDRLTIGTGGSLTLAGTVDLTGTATVAGGAVLQVNEGATLKLHNAATAVQLLQTVTGAGNITLATNVDLEGADSKAAAPKTKATGTLTLDHSTLKLGKMGTSGAFADKYVDLSSFSHVKLDNATLWVHAAPMTINGVTVENGTSNIHIQDTSSASKLYLTLAGTTTINANSTLKFVGTWKGQASIATLDGAGTLDLAGPGGNSIYNIGGGSIGKLQISTNVVSNITGNLSLGGLNGTTGTVNAGQDLTFTGADTYSYTGTLTVGGAVTKTGTGMQTISGYTMHRAIDVQSGTLTLNGTYAIDAITDGAISDKYYDYAGAQGDNGFHQQSGTITVYTKAAEGATVNTANARFTYGAQDVTASVIDDGIFEIPASDPDYTTYHLNTVGASVDVAAAYTYSQQALTTVNVHGATGTLTAATHVGLTTLNWATGSTVNVAGDVAVASGMALASSETPAIQVQSGGVFTISTASTVDGQKFVNGESGEQGGTQAFTKLFKGLVVGVQDGGKLVLQGNMNFNDSSVSGAVTMTSGVAAMEITGNVQINTYGDGCTWALGSHSLEVGGDLWLTNKQYLEVLGGHFAAGTLKLGHDANAAGGGYRSTLTATGGSTVALGGIAMYGGHNEVNIDGSTLTFTKAEGNVLSQVKTTPTAAADFNKVVFNNATLEAVNNGWTLAPINGTTVSMTGANTIDVAAEKTITLTVSALNGAITKTGEGALVFTADGESNLSDSIKVQQGALTLSGTYVIDAITAGTVVEKYVDTTGAENANGGFYMQTGTKTVYTVTEEVASINVAGAHFFYGGKDVTTSVQGGSYELPAEPIKTTLWVNAGELAYDTYYTASEGALTTAKVAGGATLTVGTNAVGTLEYQTNGSTITLAGTGTVNAISGTGILNMAAGAHVSVPSLTVGNDMGVYSTGSGTLAIENVTLNANASRITFNSSTEIGNLYLTGGAVTLGGEGNMHKVTNLKLSQDGNRDSTVNISAGTTLHITGTAVSYDQPNRFAGSFSVSHWGAANEININGTLISEAVISSCDGTATLNVENGGRLELRDGLNRGNYKDNAITINVKDGATLAAGTTHNTDQTKNSDNMVVNLAGGSTFQAYYGAEEATAVINKVLTFGSGTVTMDAGASGKTLQLNSNIAGEGVTIVKKGEGALALNGGANVLYNTIDLQTGTLALNGSFDVSHISHSTGTVEYYADPAGSATTNGFAKYTGEVQLVNANYTNVNVGEHAVITLDGYSVDYDQTTGKAGGTVSLAAFYINEGAETLSAIQQKAPNAAVTLADGAKLVADADLSVLTVTSGKGYVEIGQNATVQAASGAVELSGSGTYVLAGSATDLGSATLGGTWTGAVKVTKNDLANLDLNTFGQAGSIVEIDGWSKHLNNTDAAVPYTYDPKLRLGTNGLTVADGYSGRTYIFAGGVEGTGNFKYNIGTSASNQTYAFTGDVSKWTGAYQSLKAGKTSTLQFYGSATVVNAAIQQTEGAINLIVGDGEHEFATEFKAAVTASSITVNANASATFNELHITQAITSTGAVTLNQNLVVSGFAEHEGAAGYYDLEGVFSTSGNGYLGNDDSYITVVNGGSVVGDITVAQGEKDYALLNSGNATLAGSGAATINYTTFYVNTGSVDVSSIVNAGKATAIEVTNGTLNVDQETTGISIVVSEQGTISGEAVNPTQVGIATDAQAEFTKPVELSGVKFTAGQDENVMVANYGEAALYTTDNADMNVVAKTLEMTDTENNVTVSNVVWVEEVVNTTGHVLTLDNVPETLELASMTIGAGSTVKVGYTEEEAFVESTVTITDTLTAGGGTLLADLTMVGHAGDQLLSWDLNGQQMTLGSTLNLTTAEGLIQLDNATMQQIAALENRGDTWELVVNGGTNLEYFGHEWFDGVFSRDYVDAEGNAARLGGDYNVKLLDNGNFGIVKFSSVPEPTTGTLSLLALAALAARRRKH